MRALDFLTEEFKGWWMLVSKDGVARVYNEDDPKYVESYQDGWRLVWDSARTKELAIDRARQEGLILDDKMHPKPMVEPKTLYRSVSLPELADIVRTGEIRGKGNRFNGFDPRHYVFFGDKIDDSLIWQGEETERQAATALGDHEIHKRFEALNSERERLKAKMAAYGKAAFEKANRAAAKAGRRVVRLDPDEIEKLERNELPNRIASMISFEEPYRALRAQFQQLSKDEQTLRDEYKQHYRAELSNIDAWVKEQPISSAILQTKPITGGAHYSSAHGDTGFSDAEYGFWPGQVKLSDLVKVHYVKDRKVIDTASPETISSTLAKLSQRKA